MSYKLNDHLRTKWQIYFTYYILNLAALVVVKDKKKAPLSLSLSRALNPALDKVVQRPFLVAHREYSSSSHLTRTSNSAVGQYGHWDRNTQRSSGKKEGSRRGGEEEKQGRGDEKDLTANICHLGDFCFIFVYEMSKLHQGKHHHQLSFYISVLMDSHSNRQVCVLSHRYGAY